VGSGLSSLRRGSSYAKRIDADAYRAFTAELTERVAADDRVAGLVAVGSMADRDYGETQHGLRVLYDDGHLLEFAVFDLAEIALSGVSRYRTLLDRGGVEEACADARNHPKPQHDDEHLFGMVVTAALVAVGRGRRGEVLSAAFLVTWGLTYLTRLIARVVPAENTSILDDFDALRRFERAYPALGEELGAIVRLAPPEAGLRLLDVVDREVRPLRPGLAWGALDAVVARAQRP
jgi:hypothetical protein